MKLAVIVYDAGDAKKIDALFVQLAAVLKANGLTVAGTVQHNDAGANACAHMVLEDIVSGRSFDISIPGEKKSQSCSLDPAALEDAAGFVEASLHRDPPPDLVLINRFGKQEVLGAGLRSVIESAVALELPLLTAVCAAHIAAWAEFTAGTGERVPAKLSELVAWCTAAVCERV